MGDSRVAPSWAPHRAEGQEQAPRRVHLSRAKGWRMPPNTVKVDRTSSWGNPFKLADVDGDAARAVSAFRAWACTDAYEQAVRRALRGKNLACWCRPGSPCHADVLLELANAESAAGHVPSEPIQDGA